MKKETKTTQLKRKLPRKLLLKRGHLPKRKDLSRVKARPSKSRSKNRQ